jgi:FkbM family methyltransferase
MSLRSILRKMLSRPKTDMDKLIAKAAQTDRFQKQEFVFRGLNLQVTDLASVAWQLKEFFEDGRMNFKSSSAKPVIYDCGANVGVSVLFYKSRYPDSIIKAFEPDPEIFSCLKNNMQNNKITGVELVNKAVWNTNDGVSFGQEGADGGSVFFEGNKITLPSVRLKELLQKEEKVDLLKIDIEGAEMEVLMDCQTELKKVQYLFVEYHSWINQKQELDKLLKILTENGFRYYIHSIGDVLKQPFVEQKFSNGLDVQLDIHAINERYKKQG